MQEAHHSGLSKSLGLYLRGISGCKGTRTETITTLKFTEIPKCLIIGFEALVGERDSSNGLLSSYISATAAKHFAAFLGRKAAESPVL